jgi:hypothetical protein
MKKLTKNVLGTLIVGAVLALVAVFTPLTPLASAACDPNGGVAGGVGCADTGNTPTSLFDGDDSIFVTVVNVLLFVIGAISVIMLIIGGIRYTVSAGNATAVKGAKDTILYAIIGLVVAFLAFALVNWVLNAINPGA